MPGSPAILAIGGAHVDRRGRMSVPFVPGASNPGTMSEDVGGGAFNALRTAIQRGAHGRLFSVRGGDAAGERVARAITAAGIADVSAVFLDRATPSYTALLDSDGDVVAALADMGLYDLAFPKQLRRAKLREEVALVDAILCDANLPAAALARLAAGRQQRPLFAIAISPAKAVRLSAILGSLACLFMNRREAAALSGVGSGQPIAATVAALRQSDLPAGVITAGAGQVVGFTATELFGIVPALPRGIADVTGAGDALAGATAVAMLRGSPLREALREGLAAAMLAVECPEAVPELSPRAFAAALALVPEPAEVQ